MNLSDLKICDLLAQELHFGRAAARANLTQPAVSIALKRVERHYGTRLFDRGPGGVELTAAGARMLPLIRAMLDRADLLREAATEPEANGGRVLRIGYGPWNRPHVRALVAGLRATMPGAEIRLHPAAQAAQRRLLEESVIDIACVLRAATAGQPPSSPTTLVSGGLRLGALVFPRAARGPRPVVLLPDLGDPALAERMRALVASSGAGDRVAMVGSPEELVDRVLAGEGSGLVDPESVPASIRGCVGVRLLDGPGVAVEHRLQARCEHADVLAAAREVLRCAPAGPATTAGSRVLHEASAG